MFRALWITSVVSNVGTYVQSVAAVWLMTTLTAAPAMTALVQTAASLPFFIFGLPAGAVADMIDRRRLLLASQFWMLAVSGALGVLTVAGVADPRLLLGLTFATAVGGAFMGPAWLAIYLELVPREELPAAVALGAVSNNVARAAGPAVGGAIVAAFGPGIAFLLNAASFVGVIVVLFVWRRVTPETLLPREHVFGAIRAGTRFVRHSPAIHRILARLALFVLPASAIWALLPVLARHEMGLDATGYGALLGSLGLGAITSAFLLPRLRERFSTERLGEVCGILFAAALAALGTVPRFPLACAALWWAGVNWMAPLSSLNVSTQSVAPAWVRARVLAFHLLVLQGGIAGGSAVWGWIADRVGTPMTLEIAAGAFVVAMLASRRVPLLDTRRLDLTPAVNRPPQELVEAAGYDEGPVLVTLEYAIDPERVDEFLATMRVVRRMRRRGGAWAWGLFADSERPGVYLESFLVESWLEHLRQHERMTVTDRAINNRARAFQVGTEGPIVRHLIARLPIG
jgi:MFS family permease